jgi:energy-coupling factor transport system permease protein
VREVASPTLFEVPFYIPFTEWGFSVPITISKVWFGIVQMVRMLSMAILAIPIPYTMAPDVYGVSFRRMGASDKFSFAMDLAFRFLPTFSRDFATTVDAQRARGYEMEVLKGGIAAKLRRLAPLIIPVTMQATVTGEDVIDAMDLRAFDTNKRTWIKSVELKYAPRDYAMLGLGAAIFVGCCLLKWVFGVGAFFIPDFFTAFLGY